MKGYELASCAFCNSSETHLIENSDTLKRVTSDCRPFPQPDRNVPIFLQFCDECCLVTTVIEEAWIQLTKVVYESYLPYRQGLGKEELSPSKGSPLSTTRPRSYLLQDYILEILQNKLPRGNWLEFGGGNGNFLKSASRRKEFLSVPFFLFDSESVLNEARKNLEKTNLNVSYVNEYSRLQLNSFSVISLIHVFEHLLNPLSILDQLLELLEKDGLLIIQVPNIQENEYALTIGDHATHFSHQAFKTFLYTRGYKVIAASNSVITGESTFVLGNEDNKKALNLKKVGPPANLTVNRLIEAQKRIIEFENTTPELGIFGTSIAGTWTALCREYNFDYWVDESPDRAGLFVQDRKVYLPSEINSNNALIVPLGISKIDSVLRRMKNFCEPGLLFVP